MADKPNSIPIHPSGLNPEIVAKIFARRERLHAYETIEPSTTALVVIDMMKASVDADKNCERIVPNINAMAFSLRAAGGVVAWVTVAPLKEISENLLAVYGRARVAYFHDISQAADSRSKLYEDLDCQQNDIEVMKTGASAFFPGKCELHNLLRKKGINTVLIAGAVTNVCCESSARDAAELGYRVVMVSNACAGQSFGLHEATLHTIYRCFGDVRPSNEIIKLIEEAAT